MMWKTGWLGGLIYAALALHAAAWIIGLAGRRSTARGLFALGSLSAFVALVGRGIAAGHVPLQSLFEIFLAMGALVYPLACLWGRLPGGAGQLDPLIGVLLLWPAGWVFPETPRPLPPALQSPLFLPHVLAYLVAYVLLFKAAGLAFAQFRRRPPEEWSRLDATAGRLAEWGYPALTLGLLLGAWWGQLAWGRYWNWDPKELWALATWLIYTGYFHCRIPLGPEARRTRAGLLIAGFAAILLTVTWVNLSRLFPGLHSYTR